MTTSKLAAWAQMVSLLLATLAEAQTSGPAIPHTTNRKPAQSSTSTDWDAQVQKYQALLNDVDVVSDPDVKRAVYSKWVEATCRSKRAKVQQAIGGADTGLATSTYSACVKRLQSQESTGSVPGGAGATTASPSTAGASGSNTPPNVTLPQGCTSPPQLSDDFKTDKPVTFPTPSTDAFQPDPKWVQLNGTSSGGEISAKSTVWLGYINRLRYNATLGGVVTSIAAPSIPNTIFPTATPAPASQPAENKPTKAGPLRGVQSVFDSFNDCYQNISTTVVTFQSRLGSEELVLNDARDRIGNHIDSLQPIVNSVEEARGAADRSKLPQNEIPAFPIGDIIQLRGLLTEFISKYAQFAQWVSSDSWNASEFQRVSSGAASTAQALDKYLAASTPSANAAAPTRATKGAAPGGANAGGASGGANSGGTPTPAAPQTGATGGAGAGAQGAAANAGAGPGGTQQAAGPSALEVGSQEVKDYEANREYINKWSDVFRTVSTAPAAYFVVTYKPQCGGWFGQGTSTQMQLTFVDATNLGQKSTPTNLDKVVCQSVLTVTNGLGLSFISDKTPAFVPSDNTGTNGSPVLGYSSVANVRPGYAVQVNGAFWSHAESNFEFHWALGAMLTAATGGATTDIITGPSFSFKKRAFFITPVYDLGLRTVLQSGFKLGTPQGVLTSPPTQQKWKSGVGITITFPLSPGSNTTNSSNSAAGAGAAPANTSGGTKSTKGKTSKGGSGSNSGSGG